MFRLIAWDDSVPVVLRVTQISHKRLLSIAVPIVLSNVTVPILGAVDTGVIGQLGDAAAIGAVGIGAVVIGAIYWLFGFLRMGTTGLAAQAFGAGDQSELSALLLRSVIIAGMGGAILIAAQGAIFNAAFFMSPASPAVETLARQYMEIRIYSAPAAIAIYGATGWLIAQERTRAVFAIQFLMNGVNVILDIWFVLGLDYGVVGVAYATLIAEILGAGLALFFCRSAWTGGEIGRTRTLWDRARWKHMVLVNRDILLRSLMLQVIFVSFLLIGSKFDDTTLAANQVLLQFLHITAYGMDGFAFAAETLVGQVLGRRSRSALHGSVKIAGLWAMVLGAGLALAFLILGPWMISIMTTDQSVQHLAQNYLVYVIFSPFLGVVPWMLDGVFIGAARARDMRNMMAISIVVYGISLLVLVPALGNHGLWLALLVSFVARGVTLATRYPKLISNVD